MTSPERPSGDSRILLGKRNEIQIQTKGSAASMSIYKNDIHRAGIALNEDGESQVWVVGTMPELGRLTLGAPSKEPAKMVVTDRPGDQPDATWPSPR